MDLNVAAEQPDRQTLDGHESRDRDCGKRKTYSMRVDFSVIYTTICTLISPKENTTILPRMPFHPPERPSVQHPGGLHAG
jgi:hypothetical protein